MAQGKIRAISAECASDVDGWIEQAKQLQADIEQSKATASDIVKQHEASKTLLVERDDTAAKVKLLQNEIGFNGAVVNALQHVKEIERDLETVQDNMTENKAIEAAKNLSKAESKLADEAALQGSHIQRALAERSEKLRVSLIGFLQQELKIRVNADTSGKIITLRRDIAGKRQFDFCHSPESLIRAQAMRTLGTLQQR